jgi:pyruvate,water dikinase
VAARERFELHRWAFRFRLGRLTRTPLVELADDELLVRRREATALLEGALRQHVLGTAIAGGAYLLLEWFLERTTAAERFGSGLAARLTAGATGNALAQASAELERLARRLAKGGAGMGALDAGGAAAAELDAFLAAHGHRCEKEAELSEPRWADDPSVVRAILESYVDAARRGDALADLEDREVRLATRARHLARRVSRHLRQRSFLERLVPARRAAFRALLREARRYAPYRENLKDQALEALHLLRRLFLEAGGRLAARGRLEVAEDVFYLEVAEVEDALVGHAEDDLRARVGERRSERARFSDRPPPRVVLEVPGRAPQPVHADRDARPLLEGVGVSSGRVTGVARVLRSTEEAGRLAPGEVLVARVVNAGWTPLFHLAGAIVAEVGGVLSHGAIVAREYGIPAVFGAADASQIPDGARITVDGDLGIVTVEGDPPR